MCVGYETGEGGVPDLLILSSSFKVLSSPHSLAVRSVCRHYFATSEKYPEPRLLGSLCVVDCCIFSTGHLQSE